MVCVLLGPQKQAGGGALWGVGSPLLALGYSVPVQERIHGNPEGNPLRGWPRGRGLRSQPHSGSSDLLLPLPIADRVGKAVCALRGVWYEG